ncbi:MAG: hypothetical protein QXG97_06130 [Nitrososphaerota archaeon]
MFNEAGSSIDEALIKTKLSRLRQYQRFLKILQKSTVEEFTEDFKVSGAAESYLQLRRPERYRDIPYILAEAKIIPKDFAETSSSMTMHP